MRKPLNVFIHIPKTAGSSFRHTIEANIPERERVAIYRARPRTLDECVLDVREKLKRANIVYGHFEARIHELVERECRYFTILREPVDRVLSLYKYIKYDFPAHPLHAQFNAGVTLADWLTFKPAIASNMATKLLSGRNPRTDELSRADMIRAISMLESMPAFALQENYDEGVTRICRAIELPPPREVRNRSSLSNAEFCAREGIGEDVIEMIRDLNRIDAELYAIAKEMPPKPLTGFWGSVYDRIINAFHQ